MFGRILSIISGVIIINSFYLPWFKFSGIKDISPLNVFQSQLNRASTNDTTFQIISMIGILVLGVIMIVSSVFPKLIFSAIKLSLCIFLVIIHTNYFYSNIISTNTPLSWVSIVNTSPGYLMFMLAIIIYFFVLLFAILLSPIKGVGKIIGL